MVLTEAPFAPAPLPEYTNQVVFEEFGFGALHKAPASTFAAFKYLREIDRKRRGEMVQEVDCVTVVDSGFSFTHVTAYYKAKAIQKSVKRLNVGGKVLTNLLKQDVSFRQWNMMDEWQLIDDAKEAMCFVSQNFNRDMDRVRHKDRTIRREFILPDFQTTMKPHVRNIEETIKNPAVGGESADKEQVWFRQERGSASRVGFCTRGGGEGFYMHTSLTPLCAHDSMVGFGDGSRAFCHTRSLVSAFRRGDSPGRYRGGSR